MKESSPPIPLTREHIEQQLWRIIAADIKIAILNITLTTVIGIPMALLMHFLNAQTNDRLLFHIFSVLLPLVPIFIVMCQSYTTFIDRIYLKRGAFDVIDSSLYYKDEKHVRHIVNYYFYFESYPPCTTSYAAYQLASAGDPYILVLYRTNKPRVKLFYAAKMYNYQTT